MPAMERLYRELHPQGFELLAISVDEEAATVSAFRDRLGISFPILLDSEKKVAREWQTFAFPESLLVGRDGRVIERYVGPREWDSPAYVERFRSLLTAPAP
jgi:peroxiredoxin